MGLDRNKHQLDFIREDMEYALDYWVSKYGDLKVTHIGIVLEYWAVEAYGYGEPLYADEITVNGVTYNIRARESTHHTEATVHFAFQPLNKGGYSLREHDSSHFFEARFFAA
jgi:hypothetical protein